MVPFFTFETPPHPLEWMRFHELFLNDVDMFLWSGGVHPDGGPRRCQVSVILCLIPLRQHPSLNLKFIVFASLAV